MLLVEHENWGWLKDFYKQDLNPEIKIEELTFKCHKKIAWVCPNNHIFLKEVVSATTLEKNRFCSDCCKIPYTHPELLEEWDYERNLRKPETIGSGFGKVFWICKFNKKHLYEMAVHNKIKGKRCPVCIGRKIIIGVNDFKNFYPELELFYSKDNKTKFSEIFVKSRQYFYWTCSLKHKYKKTLESIVKDSSCPYCSNKKFLPGFNSVADVYPKNAKEWSSKNKISANEVFCNANEYAWFVCRFCNFEFKTIVFRRTQEINKCLVCSGQVIKDGFNSLKDFAPELVPFLDNENNVLKAGKIGRSHPVFWKCEFGHSYKAAAKSKLKGFGFCNTCRPISHPEKEVLDFVKEFLGKDFEVLENDRTVIKPYELDIYIPSLNKAIEFNGDYWHSDEMIFKTRGITADEYHNMKEDLCISSGVDLLFVKEYNWRNKNKESIIKIKEFLVV